MMRLRRVTDRAGLAAYARLTEARLGVRYTDEYLSRSRVYALFDEGGTMRGGTLYCMRPPFRAIEGIPEPHRAKASASLPRGTFEATGLWLDRSVRAPMVCAYFWLGIWLVTFLAGRHGVFTYSARVRVLREIYRFALQRTLYEGEVFCAGMSAPDHEVVGLATVWTASLRVLIVPWWFVGRVLRRSKSGVAVRHEA
ncbi:MAG: hypothetical protein IT381_05855 [Deltaproteobacteria bacterium]|nr:hypothetical protein [Deltaproteobacteria bacterium]